MDARRFERVIGWKEKLAPKFPSRVRGVWRASEDEMPRENVRLEGPCITVWWWIPLHQLGFFS